MIDDIIFSIKEVIRYNNIPKKNKEFVFFSENINYKNFFINLIDLITTENKKVIYISCDKEDNISSRNNIINICLPSFIVRIFFLSIINCTYFFLTTSDLGFNEIKKSKNCYKYIYIFHSLISCHVQYNEKAFFNYDVFCCNTKFQYYEMNKIINKYNLKNKTVIKSGYLYGDYLKKLKASNQNSIEKKNILIAPTWFKDKAGLFDNGLEKLIKNLINQNYLITLRLHPEHIKRSRNNINNILNKFDKTSLKLEENILNFESLKNSHYLITDYSGIAIEYMFYFNKPSLYFETPKKIHNLKYKYISEKSFEEDVKKNFGTIFSENDIYRFGEIIERANYEFESRKEEMSNYFLQNIYNVGNADRIIFSEINKI